MDLNRMLARYEKVIKSAATKYAARLLAEKPSEFDDVMNEARIAAWHAIKHYDQSKKAKIETFIFNCVRNKMFDLLKHSRRSGRDVTDPTEDLDTFEDNEPSVEHRIFLGQVLNKDELELLMMIRRGGGAAAFIHDLGRTTGLNPGEAKEEVAECLRRIQLKLESSGRNQNVLTLKQRSRKRNGEIA